MHPGFPQGNGRFSTRQLIADPDIDLVTVATRVPDHRDLVLAALAAGKHVYSEWPLGRGSMGSEELARAAQAAGVRHAIGLQLRASPAVRAAREVVASGSLGRLLAVSTRQHQSEDADPDLEGDAARWADRANRVPRRSAES